MKTLKSLNNVEKARLLHILLPDEVPGILKYTEEVALVLERNPELFRKTWKNQSFSIDLWFSLATEAATKIREDKIKFIENDLIFARELFTGLSAVFMIHCLRNYLIGHKYTDPQFINAVNLFFN